MTGVSGEPCLPNFLGQVRPVTFVICRMNAITT